MFGFGKAKKRQIKEIVDEHLAETGKEVVVQKTEQHIHHHYYPDKSSHPRQDGATVTGSEAIRNIWS